MQTQVGKLVLTLITNEGKVFGSLDLYYFSQIKQQIQLTGTEAKKPLSSLPKFPPNA